MSRLKISFERGGTLYAELKSDNLTLTENLIKILPVDTEVYHTRWCGREIYMPVKTESSKAGDEVTKYVSKFDLVHWKNEKEETVSLFYGAESLNHYGGPIYVEIIGRVSVEQEDLLDEIGQRIWLQGKEKVKIEYFN